MENKRVWLYCRVAHQSTEGFELDMQVECLKQFAAEHGYVCIGMTKEYGSGTTLNRPGLEALSNSLLAAAADIVIVKDLSRLARGYRLTRACIRSLEKQGINLISVKDQLYFGKDTEHFWAEKSECSYSIFQML